MIEPDAAIDCPKCRLSMERMDVAGVFLDRCRSCDGMWLDVQEKERLLKSPDAVRAADRGERPDHDEKDDLRSLVCPRDGSTMIAMRDAEQRHVRYEACTVCGGIFLDAGELRDLADVTLLERLRQFFG